MQTIKMLCVLLVATSTAGAEPHPTAHLTNGLVEASVYLPDAESGYYRATRFDWSGVIYRLGYAGHEYFDEWQDSDDPYLHDRITGPVDCFSPLDPLGYDEAPAGGSFLRIGVGMCEKPDEEAFVRTNTYRILDHGTRQVTRGANWIEFVHHLGGPQSDYAYRYAKRLTLTPGTPEMVIDYVLENVGRLPIETTVYNHNFFVIDEQPTGPDFVVRFPFAPVADRELNWAATVRGRELVFGEPVPEGSAVFGYFEGYGTSADDHRFEIENRHVGAGVRVATDKPLARLRLWAPSTTVCPEPFVALDIRPGHADRWSTRYEFYELE